MTSSRNNSELEKFLIEFTMNILVNNPADLNTFALNYFKKKLNEQNFELDLSEPPQSSTQEPTEESKVDETFEESAADEISNDILELEWDFKKKKHLRRCSVFSKSFDPDSNHVEETYKLGECDETSPKSLDEIEEENSGIGSGDTFEIVKNKQHEHNPIPKTEEQRVKLRSVLNSIVIFKHLDEDEIEHIIDSMFQRSCIKDETIIRQGDSGYYFYIILDGCYEIFIKDRSCQSKQLDQVDTKYTEYIDKGFFGELSLLYNQVQPHYCILNLMKRTLVYEMRFILATFGHDCVQEGRPLVLHEPRQV